MPGGFTVQPGQTFDLEGTVIGPVTIKGSLEPDFFSGTFNGNLTLSGTTSIMLGTTIRILGELNCGGDLNVQPFGFGPSGPGAFKLFSASRITGAFRSITLPWPGYGLMWDTNTLTSQGTLTLRVIPQQIALLSLTNGTSAVQFQTVQGRTYQLLSATSLQSSSPWMTVTTISGSNRAWRATPFAASASFMRS